MPGGEPAASRSSGVLGRVRSGALCSIPRLILSRASFTQNGAVKTGPDSPAPRARRCWRRAAAATLAAVVSAGCQASSTDPLDQGHRQRFESEGIVREAADLPFRRIRAGDGPQTQWDQADASILVTHETVVIHRGDRLLLEITTRSSGQFRVARERDSIAIQVGGGPSWVSWSFRPPEDVEGWTEDVRAVVRRASAKSTRWGRVPDDPDDADEENPAP